MRQWNAILTDIFRTNFCKIKKIKNIKNIRYNQVQSGTIRYHHVPSGTIRYHQVPSGTSGYQWVPMYQVPVYQVYQEYQDQISGATYISDVVFPLILQSNVIDQMLIILSTTHPLFDRIPHFQTHEQQKPLSSLYLMFLSSIL